MRGLPVPDRFIANILVPYREFTHLSGEKVKAPDLMSSEIPQDIRQKVQEKAYVFGEPRIPNYEPRETQGYVGLYTAREPTSEEIEMQKQAASEALAKITARFSCPYQKISAPNPPHQEEAERMRPY